MRYQVRYAADPVGTYSEFSAFDDDEALAHVANHEHIYGEARWLSEVIIGLADQHRQIDLGA